MTQIAKEGRRYYLQGLPFDQKDLAKALGCKFDWDKKCWWTGKAEVALQVAGQANAAPAAIPSNEEPKSSPANERPAPGRDQVVAGKAQYKGKTYYQAGRIVRGRTHWDDRVEEITTRDGAKLLLCFRDGSKSFWAARAECKTVKTYTKPQTIGRLLDFAEEAKQAHRSGRCRECGTKLETWHDGFHAGLCHDCF